MRDVPHERLAGRGLLDAAALGGDDERLWLDCDLASLAEHRLGDPTDPRALTPERRAHWQERATLERPLSLRERAPYDVCYWLLEHGERVGTVALSRSTFGGLHARVSSLYVLPTHRGRGVGQRALARLGAALAEEGFGYRLDTSWNWQRTVRFYLLRVGLWVYMWKRDLDFFWSPGIQRPLIEVGERDASIAVMRGDAHVVLASARFRGDRLELDEPSRALLEAPELKGVAWHATSTLSLALALEGRPLVRSPEHWEEDRYADGGAPEALAYKTSTWEAFDRAQGWRVDAPRIPGVEYPTWVEFEAQAVSEPRPAPRGSPSRVPRTSA